MAKRRMNPNSLKNLRAGNKRGKSAYTIVDLMTILQRVEKRISREMTKKTGKPTTFNFIEFCTEQAIKGSERLQIAILDRICPETKQVNVNMNSNLKIDFSLYGVTESEMETIANDIISRRQTKSNEVFTGTRN